MLRKRGLRAHIRDAWVAMLRNKEAGHRFSGQNYHILGGNAPKYRADFRAKYWVPMLRNIHGYGFWAASNSVEAFGEAVDRMLGADIQAMGERGYEFFLRNYTVQHSYDAVMGHFGTSTVGL